MKEIDGIRIVDMKDITEPVFHYFGLEYGDSKVIDKCSLFLQKIIELDDEQQLTLFIKYSNPFDFFLLQNLFSYISDFSWKEKNINIYAEEIETTYSSFLNKITSFCVYTLSKTSEFDDLIKYFLTYQDLLYYIQLTPNGKRNLSEIYSLRGLDFFLVFKFSGTTLTATDNNQYFEFAEFILNSLNFTNRKEEAEFVKYEIEARKQGLKEITEEFSIALPEKTLEYLRIHSERFWHNYLGEEIFSKIDIQSRNELVDSVVTEILIEKKVLTNISQLALAFCKVIERELNNSLFIPYKEVFQNGIVKKVQPDLSNKQKGKVVIRLNTIEVIKKCISANHQPTFGQIIFLMRFWNDPTLNEYCDVFSILKSKNNKFENIEKSVKELLQYMEEKLNGLTVIDIRNSSAHPTIDRTIDWNVYVKWIKQMLGEPPKEILRRILIDLR